MKALARMSVGTKLGYGLGDFGTNLVLNAPFLCAIAAVPLWLAISRRWSKRAAFLAGSFVLLAALLALWFVRSPSMLLVFILLVIAGAGIVLDATGYIANAAQSAGALRGIIFSMTLLPALFLAAAAACLAFYPINPAFHRRIVQEIGDSVRKG